MILVALFMTVIPTTIGALLSAIGIAGMDRLVRFNVLAMSGRAVEAAGDVDTLLLDKTGTITLGDRQATEFKPLRGVTEQELGDAAQLASLADETPEGRSIVVLAETEHGIRGRQLADLRPNFIPFSAQSWMSGVEVGGSWVRKGAVGAILNYVNTPATAIGLGSTVELLRPNVSADMVSEVNAIADVISKSGGTPAGSGKGRKSARRHSPQGYHQGRHPRALRRASPDGDPHGDDHRRQSNDCCRDCSGSGRRRFPCASHARGQATAHPRRAG